MKIAAANAGSIGVGRSRSTGSLPPLVLAGDLVALRPRDRVELARVRLELLVGGLRRAPPRWPRPDPSSAHLGRVRGVAVGRVQDVANPDRARRRSRSSPPACRSPGPGAAAPARGTGPGRRRSASSAAPRAAGPRGSRRESMPASGTCVLERRVHDRRDDLGDAPDAVRAVGALDDVRRRVLGGGQQRVQERWSSEAFLSMKPRSPPWSLVASVETALATVSQSLPALRSASAWSALALAAAFSASVGDALAGGERGLHLDHPRVAQLGRRGLLREAGVHVRVGDGHALPGGELLHDWSRRRAARARSCLACCVRWSSVDRRAFASGGPDLAGRQQRADPARLVVDAGTR